MAKRWGRAGLVLAGVALAVWAGYGAVGAGASFTDAFALVSDLPWAQVAGLTVVWLLGLVIHTVVLAASMPGLTHGRALVLNLSGSAVSNVLPLGGVAGTALNLTMTRAWGHSNLDFARFVVVSKACDVIAKLVLPIAAVVWLLLGGALTPATAAVWWLPAAGALAAGLLVAAAISGRAEFLLRWVGRRNASWAGLLTGTRDLVRRRRTELITGMAGYWVAQCALLWCCLLAVGLRPSLAVVFAAFVAERAATLLLITPGGAGPAEAAMVTTLIALGADPTASLAGVVLFRAFVFAAEIPAGALVTLWWWAIRRYRARNQDGMPPVCA
ncbi:flippase-like domain-containing protein [Actinoplanes bogorensis]|uniref:Flippase-like domain-containing protein n=1 Tax=Paractinoplanes bogorensis TaxID=1610840 RepID=A0ABS5YXB8_9ACTN|nr:lysylphosphatidylglycerol synthase transmembrane domain-containing protein [Actinoplanes bogorensis]MBU2668082.1 flippase-like domain-containing protein [Actinoplanes bogorensis]